MSDKTKGTILSFYLKHFDERTDRKAARELAERLIEPLWELRHVDKVAVYEALAMMVGAYVRATTEDESNIPVTVAIISAEIALVAFQHLCTDEAPPADSTRELKL